MELVLIIISFGLAFLIRWAIPELTVFETIISGTILSIMFELLIITDEIKRASRFK